LEFSFEFCGKSLTNHIEHGIIIRKSSKGVQPNRILSEVIMASTSSLLTGDESASTKIWAEATPDICLRAKVEILGFELTGALDKQKDGVRFLTELGPCSGNDAMSIKDIAVKLAPNLEGGITDLLATVGLENPSLTLNTAYCYYSGCQDDITNGLNTEYAFSMKIENSTASTIGILNIKQVEFAIWNTTRKKVKQDLNLAKIEDALNALKDL
jgi:hypothetical protein